MRNGGTKRKETLTATQMIERTIPPCTTIISNVALDLPEILLALHYNDRLDKAEFDELMEHYTKLKNLTEIILNWANNSLELFKESINHSEQHKLMSLTVDMDFSVSAMKGFYRQKHMSDYFSNARIVDSALKIKDLQQNFLAMKDIAVRS